MDALSKALGGIALGLALPLASFIPSCLGDDPCQPTDCPAPVEVLLREAEPALLTEPLTDLTGTLTLGVDGELIGDFSFTCPLGIGDCSDVTADGLILDTDSVTAGDDQIVFFRVYDGGGDGSPDLLTADHVELRVQAPDGRLWTGGQDLVAYDEPDDRCGCTAQVGTLTVEVD